jgi:putative transposase
MIDRLGQSEPIAPVCALFGVTRSFIYAHRQRCDRLDTPRMTLLRREHQLFLDSRSSAGSRSIMGMMREQGLSMGRFKAGRLMAELGLICKQPGNHAYKQATVERVDIPNRLNGFCHVAGIPCDETRSSPDVHVKKRIAVIAHET